MVLMITKRTGEVVEFDSLKIKEAIQKAVYATNKKIDEVLLDSVVEEISNEIGERFSDLLPNVENIQDIIEKHLIRHDLYEIAKAYILYRAERAKFRHEEKKKDIEKIKLGKLTVKKRDGRVTLFSVQKARNSIVRASKGYEKDISADLILKEAIKGIYDGVTTEGIEKSMIMSSLSFVERDPAYSYVAGRLFLQRIYKEVLGRSISNELLDIAYREAFIDGIKQGIKLGILDNKLADYNLEKLSNALDIERDMNFEHMGIQVLYEKYFIKDNKDWKRIELPQGFWMRVAMGLAINEQNKEEKAIEFYNILSSFLFVSSTPTLFNSGTKHPQLSSCYLSTVMDDLDHIFKFIGDNAKLSKWAGGLGDDWTNIRGTGSLIKGTGGESQGVIPFMKIASDTAVAVNQGGKRKGAMCGYLETWHLDIEEFLDLRKNTGDERRRTHDMNTANWIPDLFMKRVIEDKEWTLFSPNEVPELHHIYGKAFEKKYEEYEELARKGEVRTFKTIEAKKLWRKMISMLFETGHPWMTWKDPCNIRSPQDHAGVIHSSNLCTEITLNTSAEETAVCNLGSINLGAHIKNSKIDEELLARTIRTAIRMLDNVIDINFYPTIEAKTSNLRHRPIGMGLMGFQDALYRLDIPFESTQAKEFADSSMEMIAYYAILASSELAKERGPYSSFKGSKWDRNLFPQDTVKILEEERGIPTGLIVKERLDWSKVREHVKQYGMRNSNTMAIAPTATISSIVGCYPCIEPIYNNVYVKSKLHGEFTIINANLVTDLKKIGLWNQEMLEQLKYYSGSVQLIPAIPEHLKRKYKEAFEIDPEWLVEMTAVRGIWIDQAQSHNIFFKGSSGKKLSDVYMKAWTMGMKTTYYLRTLGASQIEKSTLDASKFGFTQKRDFSEVEKSSIESNNVIDTSSLSTLISPPLSPGQTTLELTTNKKEEDIQLNKPVKQCLLDNPDCESCQ